MLGDSISARALGDAGRRVLPTEQVGARPAGVRGDETERAASEARATRATKP